MHFFGGVYFLFFRLFDTDIKLPEGDLIVSYTFKMSETTTCDVFLQLEVKESSGSNAVWILREEEITHTPQNMTVFTPTGEVSKEIPSATVAATNGWVTR